MGSGSSAITDLISEFRDCQNEFKSYEYVLLHCPNGLFDFEDKLLIGNNAIRSDEAIRSFETQMKKLYNKKFWCVGNYQKIISSNFMKITEEYINNIQEFNFPGYWYTHEEVNTKMFFKLLVRKPLKILTGNKVRFNKILKYSTTNRDGYREYKSNPSDCKSCEHLNICTNSKNKQKLVTRHIWQNYLEEADHLRHKPYVKKVYSKRKETIERVFADAKEKHGMRYTKLRGLSKIEMEVSLIFSCMNLKKLANWMWKDTSNNLRLTPIFSILSLKIFIKKKIAILYKLKMAILSTI